MNAWHVYACWEARLYVCYSANFTLKYSYEVGMIFISIFSEGRIDTERLTFLKSQLFRNKTKI